MQKVVCDLHPPIPIEGSRH